MSEESVIDDQSQSHYEISLTAGQAFVAFVLLLLSLAASFAFGLMIGKGQADERLVVRKEPAVINEGSVIASKKNDGKLIDLGVGNDDFKAPAPATTSSAPPPAPAPTITEGTITPLTESAPAPVTATAAPIIEAPKPAPKPAVAPVSSGPAYAQLLVTSDQK